MSLSDEPTDRPLRANPRELRALVLDAREEAAHFGPAVYPAPTVQCLDCRARLSAEDIAKGFDLCDECGEAEDDWSDDA